MAAYGGPGKGPGVLKRAPASPPGAPTPKDDHVEITGARKVPDRWETSGPATAATALAGSGGRRSGREWCPGRDLNPDELPHTPRKRTRIPIPPPGHQVRRRKFRVDQRVRGVGTEDGT